MDFRGIIKTVESLAHSVSGFIPGANMVEGAAEIGTKVLDVIDAVSAHAEPADQERLQAARSELAAKVTAHAASTSSRLRGS